MQETTSPQETIDSFLTQQRIRPIQLFHLGIVSASLAFLFVVMIIYSTAQITVEPDGDAIERMQILSFTVALFSASVYSIAPFLSRISSARTKGEEIGSMPIPTDSQSSLSPIKVYNAFMVKRIIRLALLEGPAILGSVICIIGSQNGMLHAHPMYWLNSAPTFILFLYVVLNFPTRERLLSTLHP